ncbi:MAG: hypothetical protein KJO55_07450, partial [Gammaproteobacteria bacterium]|nr:hypothetical protein [Gammaproteobacteria bacterium]
FEHWRRWQPAHRDAVAPHRAGISAILQESDALLVAGGHVGILLNRMRLYDIGPLISDLPLIGWSAGAMALSERVLLFHDYAPQTPGYAEILDAGLGAYRGVVALPDAEHRLILDDPTRVEILAGRLRPAIGVALNEPSVLHWDGRNWHAYGETLVLRPSGKLEAVTE